MNIVDWWCKIKTFLLNCHLKVVKSDDLAIRPRKKLYLCQAVYNFWKLISCDEK